MYASEEAQRCWGKQVRTEKRGMGKRSKIHPRRAAVQDSSHTDSQLYLPPACRHYPYLLNPSAEYKGSCLPLSPNTLCPLSHDPACAGMAAAAERMWIWRQGRKREMQGIETR